jgi:F-box/TPR repeat protein Pof3
MPTHATLVNISSPDVDIALLYLSQCPNLEYLDIRMPCEGKSIYELFKTSKSLRALITSEDIPFSQRLLTRFLADLPALERIECHITKLSPESNRMRPAKMPNLKAIALRSVKEEYPLVGFPLVHLWDDVRCLINLFLKVIRVLIEPLQKTFSDSIPNLEELRVRWISPRSSRSFYPFFLSAAGLPNLRRLDISGMVLTKSIMDLPPNLEYLRFHNCRTSQHYDDVFDEPLSLKLPRLHSILFPGSPRVAERLRILLDASGGALRHLYVDGCDEIWTNLIFKILIESPASKGLRELGFAYMYGFSDSHVVTLLNNMPELKALRIPCTDITGCTIKAIAEARLASLKEAEGENLGSFQQRKPSIEIVDICGCEDISLDVVEYGRAQGIEIIK